MSTNGEPTQMEAEYQAPVTVVVAEAQRRTLPPAAQVKPRRGKKVDHKTRDNSDSPKKGQKKTTGPNANGTKRSNGTGGSGGSNGPSKDQKDQNQAAPRPPRPVCENCPKTCQLCVQKDRDEVSKTHCMICCIYCSFCDRKGHNHYNEDGSIQCFKARTCEICKETGHSADVCRRDWCETCRDDGKGHNFVGHTAERCRKNHKCTVCGRKGHLEDRCKVCEKCGRPGHLEDTCRSCDTCGQAGHVKEQCDRDKHCTICDKYGHSEARCRACQYCGFAMPGKDAKWEHKCKRNFDNSCRECGGVGVGKCSCYDYVR